MTLEEKYKAYIRKQKEAEQRRNKLQAELDAYTKQYEEKKKAILDEFGMDDIEDVKTKIKEERAALENEKAEKEAELDRYLAM